MLTEVGRPIVTRPKLAEAGSIHVVASAATERFSRPAPCAVGPTSCNPVAASLTTKSARFTSADLICAGSQSLCSCKSTAAEPAICGVDIEVPLRKAHGAPPQSTGSVLTQELRTLTPTEVKSGLTAKSTLVGPWPLEPAKISLFCGVMNSWNVASADAVIAPDARSAAPSFLLIITAGRSSSNPAVLAIEMGSPATLLMMRTAIAPAAFAFATFWLKTHDPRSMMASLPEAPGSTLAQPSDWVSNRS